MTALSFYTPDSMDVNETFREALEDLFPKYKSPVEHLFAVDGLGNQPRLEAALGFGERIIT